jgi:peptidyl-prolyl cis-trans isomerase A (cyclophilin A)
MLVTSLGDMVVELDAVNAPKTVANFIEYVEAGFYDGTIFHRVIPDFVLQGGGFTPGLMEKPTNAPIALETTPKLTHVDGAIAMARTDDPDSATSQFYICDGPQPGLDGMYAVFGVLVSGLDVRDAISIVATQEVAGYMDVPVEDVVIEMAYCVAAL